MEELMRVKIIHRNRKTLAVVESLPDALDVLTTLTPEDILANVRLENDEGAQMQGPELLIAIGRELQREGR